MVLSQTDSLPLVRERVRNSARRTVERGYAHLAFSAMSCPCRVFFSAEPGLARVFQDEVLEWVAWFEARYSRFIPDSLISKINAAAGEHWVEIDAETEAIFGLCQELPVFLGATKGVFDPTALPLIRLWNWKAERPVVPEDQPIQKARALVGWTKVQRRPGGVFLPLPGMMIDLGGIGKEYAVDRVLTMLGCNAGSRIFWWISGRMQRARGQSPEKAPWRIGLEDPRQPGSCWTSVLVTDHAVATSGNYLRNFVVGGRRYGHIIDPRSGYPADNDALSASIIAPHCTFAGIVSTAAIVLGPREGLQMMSYFQGIEGAIITPNNRHQTRGFNNYATA